MHEMEGRYEKIQRRTSRLLRSCSRVHLLLMKGKKDDMRQVNDTNRLLDLADDEEG